MLDLLLLEPKQAAAALQLVRFYLPRILAADGNSPSHWLEAFTLQQLGEQVLAAFLWQQYTRLDVRAPAELLQAQRALARVETRGRTRRRAPAGAHPTGASGRLAAPSAPPKAGDAARGVGAKTGR